MKVTTMVSGYLSSLRIVIFFALSFFLWMPSNGYSIHTETSDMKSNNVKASNTKTGDMKDLASPASDKKSAAMHSRVTRYTYKPDKIYPLHLKMGYQLTVELHPDEVIHSISSGNKYAWTINVLGHRLLIKPLEDDIITNVFILTNERSYHFEVKSDSNMKPEDVSYLVKFEYGPESEASVPLDSVDITTFFDRSTPLNYGYTYVSGDDFLPRKICDNGINTFIETNMELDIYDLEVWINHDNGDDPSLVTGYIDGCDLYIAGLHDSITIKAMGYRMDVYRVN